MADPDQLTFDQDPGRNMIGRFPTGASDASLQAAIRVYPRSGTQRCRVLETLRRLGERGATDYELWRAFGIGARPHVPATRREELIADGWPIVDSTRRRRTDTGSPAIVWVLR